MSANNFTKQKQLIFKTGNKIKLINKVEYCKSIIADGKELIKTGNESGEIRVPELKDPKVYITFKDDVTTFKSTFSNCTSLKSIPANLFANCPKVTDFIGIFVKCTSLQSLPTGLFTNCPEVIDFSYTFSGCESIQYIPDGLFSHIPSAFSFYNTFADCTGLTGESPYTMVNGKKVHLYERKDHPDHFPVAPTDFKFTFRDCTGLTDYAQIPSDWK